MKAPDMHDLLKQALIRAAEDGIQTPAIVCSGELISQNSEFFRNNLPVDEILFPVKVNHDPAILKLIRARGVSFEVASVYEARLLKEHKLLDSKVMISNPVRTKAHTQAAHAMGIRMFAVDRHSELARTATSAPGAALCFRIAVPNAGAEWALEQKFGCSPEEAIELMIRAEQLGLKPSGVSFHVGWNNRNPVTWQRAANVGAQLCIRAKSRGIDIRFLNIGGGFPAHNTNHYHELRRISRMVAPLLNELKNHHGFRIMAEPGSFIVANTAALVTQVVDVAVRNGRQWAYIDAGLFQGFFWSLKGLKYQVMPVTAHSGPRKRFTVTGPTNDSQDLFGDAVLLPAGLKAGDLLAVFPAGAYINSAREYNGFPYPENMIL